MYNKVTLIGRAGKDAEVRDFENGKVARFSLATSDDYKKGDEWVNVTDWHNLAFYGFAAHKASVVKKGDLIFIEGKIKPRKYEKEGKQIDFVEINCDKIIHMHSGNKSTEETPKEGDLPF